MHFCCCCYGWAYVRKDALNLTAFKKQQLHRSLPLKEIKWTWNFASKKPTSHQSETRWQVPQQQTLLLYSPWAVCCPSTKKQFPCAMFNQYHHKYTRKKLIYLVPKKKAGWTGYNADMKSYANLHIMHQLKEETNILKCICSYQTKSNEAPLQSPTLVM